MAAQTGNTYISGTMIDSVEFTTAILVFSTMTSSKKVPPADCNNDQQPEIAIWPPKPEILYLNSTWNYDRYHRNSYGNSIVFDQIKYFRFRRHIAISGCRSLSQSLYLNSSWSKTPGLPLKMNTFIVLLLKLVSGFFYPKRNTCA